MTTLRDAAQQALEALEPYADIKPRDWKTDREKLWRSYDVLRAALAEQPAQRKPLTDEFLRNLHHIDEFGLFCDYDDFEQIARAIERAHGIGEQE